jgi:hypothetical protein
MNIGSIDVQATSYSHLYTIFTNAISEGQSWNVSTHASYLKGTGFYSVRIEVSMTSVPLYILISYYY